MRENDQQLGWPFRAYQDTKANIEALVGLSSEDEGCVAYATDTDQLGTYNGTAWTWTGGGGSINPEFRCDGRLKVTQTVNGAYIVTGPATILAVYIYCADLGSAGSTIVDLNKNGTTVFTAQANRPTLAWDDADQVAKSGTPDVTSLAESDVLTVDIDEIATRVKDLTVVIDLLA